MKIKNIPYLVWDSLKSLVMDLVQLVLSFKKAKTWSFILYATLFLIIYYRKLTKANATIIIGLILAIYIFRRQKEPEFNVALRRKAFLSNNDAEMHEYYEKYRKQCFYSKSQPLSYEDYKREEIRKFEEEANV